jgi:hypothetical protein
MTIQLIKPDFVPMLQDAGLDDAILAAFNRHIGIDDLRMRINRAGDWDLDNDDLIHYIAERGDGLGVQAIGDMPSPTHRPDAPTGLQQNTIRVGFSKPDDGAYLLRWYVNATLVMEREQDCTTQLGRSALKSELGVEPGNVAQVCIVEDGAVGWWARIEVE